MSKLRLWAGGIAVLAVLAAGSAEAAVAAAKGWPMKQEAGGFLVVETKNYVIRTNLGADAAQMFARHQESLFLELYKRMAGNKAGSIQILRGTVLVVASKDTYMSMVGPEAKGTQGMFDPNKNQISAWGSIEGMDRTMEVLRHEGTHQFVRQYIGPKCPLWLNEGLAEFFERAQFTGGQLEVGQVPAYLVRELNSALEENRLFSVPYMLTIEHEVWSAAVKKEGKEGSLQYAEAWAMVHCLQGADNAKYQAPFTQYIWYLGRGRSSKDAWDLAFGGGVAAFEKRFRDYIKELQPTGGRTCRSNLTLLGFILAGLQGTERMPTDITAFRQSLLDGKLGRWNLRDNTGAGISTGDPEVVKSLFCCPDEKSKGDAPSYELAPGKAGEPPVVRCRCHAGFVLETVYEKDEDGTGKLKPKIVAKPANSVPPAKAAPAAKSPTSTTGAKKP